MLGANSPQRFIATSGRYVGRECWLFPQTGKVFPVVRGSFEGEGAGGGGGDGTGGDAAAQAAAAAAAEAAAQAAAQAAAGKIEFTPEQQAKVDAIVQERVAATKAATAKETAEQLAKDLGVSIDEAKTMIADAKKKAADEADTATKLAAAEAERDTEKASAKAVARAAAIRIAVADATAGLDVKDDDALKAVRADIAVLVSNEVGADKLDPTDDEVAAALKTVKDRHAAMFATKKGVSGDPGGGPNGGGNKSEFDEGAERGKKEREAATKDTPFLGGLKPLGMDRVSA